MPKGVYTSFGENLDYNPATNTYTRKYPMYDNYPANYIDSPNRGGRGYKRCNKKSCRKGYKKSPRKSTRKYCK